VKLLWELLTTLVDCGGDLSAPGEENKASGAEQVNHSINSLINPHTYYYCFWATKKTHDWIIHVVVEHLCSNVRQTKSN